MKLSTLMTVRLPIAVAGVFLGIEGMVFAAFLPDSIPVVLLGMGSAAVLMLSLFQLVRLFKELKANLQKP